MPYTLLIADDDEDNRDIAREILEAGGYQVIIATNGLDVVQQARIHKPAVILMDLSMPVMDGWQATKLLKSDETTKGIIIIAFTAHASQDDQARALLSNCDDYISKPCPPRLLLEKVTTWITALEHKRPA